MYFINVFYYTFYFVHLYFIHFFDVNSNHVTKMLCKTPVCLEINIFYYFFYISRFNINKLMASRLHSYQELIDTLKFLCLKKKFTFKIKGNRNLPLKLKVIEIYL